MTICAVCGDRMTVRYHNHAGRLYPSYVCQRKGIESATPICQSIVGERLDEAIGKMLIEVVTPVTLQVALAVQKELDGRHDEIDRLRQQEVQRARYQADLARRRYMQVDPDNRLVADSLEAEWNQRLRELADSQQRYDQQRQAARAELDADQRSAILALAKDFPRLWNDSRTPDRERKRMARLLIADVTLLKGEEISAQVRFHGGTTHTLHLPLPKPAWEQRRTPPEVLKEIDRLIDDHCDAEIAGILNQHGTQSGWGRSFNRAMVRRLRVDYRLGDRFHRLRARGMLTLGEIARVLDVSTATVKQWRHAGLLKAHPFDDKGQCLYEPPRVGAPVKYRQKFKKPRTSSSSALNPSESSERGAI